MAQFRLLDGPFRRGMEINVDYVSIAPNDRMLHMFRVTAGLSSVRKPLGGTMVELRVTQPSFGRAL
jgi:uncharacterized protein